MPATVRILLVEDDPQDAELVERQVRRADIFCTFLRVDSRDGMVKALRENQRVSYDVEQDQRGKMKATNLKSADGE